MASGITKDVKEFQFKISGQLRIFNQADKLNIESPLKLVTAASKYGLVFVGTPTGLISILSGSILSNPEIQNKPLAVTSEFPRRTYPLASQPSHLDISADNELLAVAIRIQDIPVLQIYSVSSFGASNVVKKLEMRMSNTAGVKVLDLQWNPGVPNVIGAVMSDGSVVVFEIKDTSFSLNSLPPSTLAKCLCWSPKGKQVVIGSASGSLTQYKPDLKPVKTFQSPYPSASVVSVHWPSSFQFIAAYINTSIPRDRPAVVVVNVPKGGQVSYVKYEDICFGSLSKRQEYYFIHQQVWNVIVIGCGDSMELSVLGSEANAVNWVHWKQDDSTRAELPLTDDKDDVHNLGITLDSSPNQPIQLNDSLRIGPMPVVISLSHDGVLCWFTALNMMPGAPAVCTPPQPFPDQSGIPLFTFPLKQPNVTVLPQPAIQPSLSQPAIQPASSFPQSHSIFSSKPTPQQPLQTSSPHTASPQIGSLQTGSFQAGSLQPGLLFPQSTTATSDVTQGCTVSSAFPSSTQLLSMFSTTLPFGTQPPFINPNAVCLPQSVASSVPQTSIPPLVAPQSTGSDVPTSQTPTFSVLNQALNSMTKPSSNKPLPQTSITLTSTNFMGLSQPNQSSPFSLQPVQQKAQTPAVSQGVFGLEVQKKKSPKIEEKAVSEPSVPNLQPANKQEENICTGEIEKAAYTAAIFDELTSFQQEFSQIKQYIGTLKVEVEDEKVKGEVYGKIDTFEEFSNELVETTNAQSAEVAALRISLLDILSWIQLIKTKKHITQNASLIEMRKAEDMDPISKHWCKQIELKLYSLQHQVNQAMEHIERIKNSSNGGGLYLPTFEAVLQTIINLTKIASVEKTTLSQFENKLAECVKRFQHRKKKIVQIDRHKDRLAENDSQLSMLAQKLLQTKLESTDEASCMYRESSKKMIIDGVRRKGKLDSSKECLLREWHKNHKIVHTRANPHHLSISISDFNSSLKPHVKQSSEKKPVSFTGDKVESLTSKMVKPVPSTPLSRPENKSVQLNRNLFPNPGESSFVNTGIAPLGQDLKGMFDGGITSTPLSVMMKKDQAKPSILTSSNDPPSLSTTTSTAQVSSPSFVNVKATSTSFGSTAPGSQLSIFSTAKTTTEKADAQSKSSEPTSNTIKFGSSNMSTVFNFGKISSKENVSSDIPSTTSLALNTTSSIFSKPASKPPVAFGSLNQVTGNLKPSNEESNASCFNFGSMASSLKGSGTVMSPPKEITSASVTTTSVTQPFSFNLESTPGIVTSTVTPTTSSVAPAFSFSQITPSTISLAQSTTTVNSITNPLSSFTFGGVSSSLQSTTNTPSTIAAVNPIQLTSPTVAVSTPAVSSTTSLNISPISPSVTSSLPLTISLALNAPSNIPDKTSESLTVISPPLSLSNDSFNPTTTVSLIFGGTPISTVAVAPITVSTTTSSIFNSQISFGTPIFKPPSTSVSTFGTSAFGTFTPTTTSPPTATLSPSTLPATLSTPSPPAVTAAAAASPTSNPVGTPLFGSGTMKFSAVTTSSPAAFGQSTTTTTATGTLFNQATTTSASPFGQSVNSTQLQSSPFNQSAPVQTTATTPFGQAASTFTTTASSFGSSAFGTGPVFSSITGNTFGGTSTFGTPTTTPSVFGSPTTTASSLFNTPLFGQTSQGNSSPFGAVSGQPTPLFGAASPVTQASPFAATTPANPFFSQAQAPVFGQSPSAGNFGSSGGSIFGASSSFGSNPQANQFQPTGGNIFGGGSGGGPFSSSGGQSVGQAGFGAPSFQTPKSSGGGFGSSPVFGSSPSFGGAPAFGSPTSFGSPNKVFGATNPVPSGGGFTGQTNMFDSMANQNTMTFGNLAHNQPQAIPPTFGSPQPPPQQNPPSFGGNAFSSWR